MKTGLLILFAEFTCMVTFAQTFSAESQNDLLIPGQPMPDFVLDNVAYYPKQKVSLKDFEGKWLVLDFWASNCLPCIKSFPKMNDLQGRFKDKVQFIMIGIEPNAERFAAAKTLYENLRRKQKLNLVVAYDSILSKRWKILSVPHVIIVDDHGTVRVADAKEREMNEENLEALFSGKTSKPLAKKQITQYNESVLFQTTSTGEYNTDLLFSSVLSKYNNQESYYPPLEFEYLNGKWIFKIVSAPLAVLYKYAYVGKYGWYLVNDSLHGKIYPEIILEVKDSSSFMSSPDSIDNGMYNYSIWTSAKDNANPEYIQEVLRSDLKNYFGYDVNMELREMPCWNLITTSDATANKIRTRGGSGQYPTATAGGFKAENVPMGVILAIIGNYFVGKEPPFVDKTSISSNIDIKIDALMTDFNALKRALQKNGLDLIKGHKEMKAIVISDSTD